MAAKDGRRPPEAPKNLKDHVVLLAGAIKFHLQILVKWRPFDLSRAIFYAITDKDKKTVAMECGERSDCKLLKGPELLEELYELKKLLTHTKLIFSQKRFRTFLFAAGFAKEDVLFSKRKARILKPVFTVLRDKESKCLLVFIRGTRSIKDTLTDAIAAPVAVSFSYTICSDGGAERNNEVSGYAHRGVVASARWIRKHCTPILLDALRQYPDFKIKVVGHSLGGGTAALLTYMLREIKQFSSSTCVTFGPVASTSLELAEFGKPFITSIINGSDVVPTLSASSVRGFIAEGRDKHKNFQNAVGSRFPLVSTARAVAGHACHGFKVLLRSRRENIGASSSSKSDESTSDEDESNSSIEGSDNDDTDEEEEQIIYGNQSISDEELLNQLEELELGKQNPINIHVQEKEAATAKDITEESSGTFPPPTKSKQLDIHALYPSGRIIHIVTSSGDSKSKKPVYLYETATQLYGKLRLSRRMIFDHFSKKYLKMLNKAISQLQEEQDHDNEAKNSKGKNVRC